MTSPTCASVLAACSALLLSTAAGAEPQSPGAREPSVGQAAAGSTASEPAKEQESAEVGDPDRRICKKITYTGSRLGGEKVCKSARQWSEIRQESRDATERRQRSAWRTD
jgi:hypothetical protein